MQFVIVICTDHTHLLLTPGLYHGVSEVCLGTFDARKLFSFFNFSDLIILCYALSFLLFDKFVSFFLYFFAKTVRPIRMQLSTN